MVQKFDRLHEAIKTSILWSTIFCAMFGLAAAISLHRLWPCLQKGDMEMIRIGSFALRANGLSFYPLGSHGIFVSVPCDGKAVEGCFLGACRQGICFVPVILLLPGIFYLDGILFMIADVSQLLSPHGWPFIFHKELSAAKAHFLATQAESSESADV